MRAATASDRITMYYFIHPQRDWAAADYTIIYNFWWNPISWKHSQSMTCKAYPRQVDNVSYFKELREVGLGRFEFVLSNTSNFRSKRRIVCIGYIFKYITELPGSNPPEWTAHLILPIFYFVWLGLIASKRRWLSISLGFAQTLIHNWGSGFRSFRAWTVLLPLRFSL